jgi:hypothetical protein
MPQPGQERTARISKPGARIATAALLVLSALLLLPAVSQAAQVFGSRLLGAPTEQNPIEGSCEAMIAMPCTLVSFIEPSNPNGDPVPSAAPSDGVITQFRVRAFAEAPTPLTFVVAGLTNVVEAGGQPESASGTLVATGPTVTIQPSPMDEVPIQGPFPARVPIKKGQNIGVDNTTALVAYKPGGEHWSFLFGPQLSAGTQLGSAATTGELLIQATLEPDVDGDGFGDETQDRCPSQKATQGPCEAVKPPPVALAVSHYEVGKGKVSYELSKAATVRFRLARRAKHGFRSVGRFSGPGVAGPNRRAIPHAAKLAPGSYRLTLTASDAAGSVASVKAVFRVKR